MKAEILALLRESTDYVSGQELCQRFGVSRTAVWKAINQLKKEGHEIEAVQNRGYRLGMESDVYGPNELASRMNTKWAGRNLLFFEILDSTNICAKREGEAGAPHGTLVVTESQTAGRGRRGKGWESPRGINIYFTILLRPELAPDRASMLTLVMAHSVARVIRETTSMEARIKWPNDVVVNGKKICGILTELSAEPGYIHHLVIGTGINVGLQEFPGELAHKAASLEGESGTKISRGLLLAEVMAAFEEDYEAFIRAGDLSPLLETYHKMLVNLDARVCVLDPQGQYTGTSRGINEVGELLVEKDNGQVEQVYAGEVSVRGIYGYV